VLTPSLRFESLAFQVEPGKGVTNEASARAVIRRAFPARSWTITALNRRTGEFEAAPKKGRRLTTAAAWNAAYRLRREAEVVYAEPLFELPNDEQFAPPPRKGRRHILRLVRELLTFQPTGRGTDLKAALDYANRMLKHRGIVFLLSDFQADPQTYRKALNVAGRRHDLVAIDLRDPLEKNIAPVGLMVLEDAETGELMEVDTADPAWRKTFSVRQKKMDAAIQQVLNGAKVDRIELATPDDFVNALIRFFQNRMRRLAH
jgi:hypothetical protein